MHENVISSAKSNVERIEISTNYYKHDLCDNTKNHKWVVEALIN